MTIIASDFSKGLRPTVTADCAGGVVVQDLFIDVTAAQIVSGDIVDLGILPAYHTVVDAVLLPDDLDSNATATLTLDVGLMSGTPGDTETARTCGAELFSGDTGAQSGTATRMSAAGGFKILATESNRSIGVKFATAAATAAAGRIRLRLLMTAADHKVQF
jgi:predicted RecA/RadA family phage recombinase